MKVQDKKSFQILHVSHHDFVPLQIALDFLAKIWAQLGCWCNFLFFAHAWLCSKLSAFFFIWPWRPKLVVVLGSTLKFRRSFAASSSPRVLLHTKLWCRMVLARCSVEKQGNLSMRPIIFILGIFFQTLTKTFMFKRTSLKSNEPQRTGPLRTPTNSVELQRTSSNSNERHRTPTKIVELQPRPSNSNKNRRTPTKTIKLQQKPSNSNKNRWTQ